ncbi:hypothetical protein [Lentzea sp. NPDC003310]|uniref:hypothetical protein n=1 Tax=Lentzea sp. NPDC003310 TaxID=3154447 RepID=UPI0033B03FB1
MSPRWKQASIVLGLVLLGVVVGAVCALLGIERPAVYVVLAAVVLVVVPPLVRRRERRRR